MPRPTLRLEDIDAWANRIAVHVQAATADFPSAQTSSDYRTGTQFALGVNIVEMSSS